MLALLLFVLVRVAAMISRILLLQCLLFVGVSTSLAFTSSGVGFVTTTSRELQHSSGHQNWLTIRGGDQDLPNAGEAAVADNPASKATKSSEMSAIAAVVMAGAQRYSQALETNPIVTKSITAAFIFVASDLLAQNIEKGADKGKKLDKKRTLTASLVGLLYFGPAAHFWYENIFTLFPGKFLIGGRWVDVRMDG